MSAPQPRRLVALALLSMAVAIVGAGCHGESAGGRGRGGRGGGGGGSDWAERQPIEVELAPVRIAAAERTIDISGTLFGQEETVVSSKLSGRVIAIYKDLGDPVSPGGELAQQETRDYELELTEKRAMLMASLAKLGLTELPPEPFDPAEVPTVVRARAEEANAEARLRRARQLFEQRPPLISEQDFADIETRWEVAKSDAEVALLTARATLAEARTQAAAAAQAAQRIEDTTIRAPGGKAEEEAGLRYTVAERLVSLGEYLTEGKPTYRLVATDLIKYRAEVPERFAGHVRVGQPVSVWVEAYPEPVTGQVARISPSINPQSRTFQIEAHIPNDSARLKPGAFARGRISIARDEGVTFVPRSAVVTFAGVQKVFSVADGKAVEHRVQLGVRDGEYVEIRGGLPAAEVVTTGAAGLSAGAPVRVKGA